METIIFRFSHSFNFFEGAFQHQGFSSWCFQPVSNIFVKMDHLPRDRGENKKSLKPPLSSIFLLKRAQGGHPHLGFFFQLFLLFSFHLQAFLLLGRGVFFGCAKVWSTWRFWRSKVFFNWERNSSKELHQYP